MSTKKKLCAIKGLSEAKVDKIKEVTVKLSGVSINAVYRRDRHLVIRCIYCHLQWSPFFVINLVFNLIFSDKNIQELQHKNSEQETAGINQAVSALIVIFLNTATQLNTVIKYTIMV